MARRSSWRELALAGFSRACPRKITDTRNRHQPLKLEPSDPKDQVRHEEQNAAAVVGRYGVMIQLGYTSAEVKSAPDRAVLASASQAGC